ncbi:hypothetical protein I204_06668 [Kwoniella mangroviensis CBS 8886]|uniref:uncharacterized protein n=1 Tax=Kwoniella mangroviensis CBS 8507 TaxID=1296122 RepID=UPI00080D662F|nr:uncharacterized protein I203_01360 [Kwoniella mangroviensis CBS 8507]OCF69503.1 hypothetical protein I203_01360 [Kwoniella mangroviensis CBS 8507]OCF72289.1 hypothetical protein I204_06668 [Kwoniella mangroviensis CBS 8886]
MSYFSDNSSTCSAAPPLTPSPPQHDSQHHSNPYSSPTPYDPTSPPASLRNYSSALVRQMSAGLKEAMKDLKDDRGGPERKFDVEYGYDEDPIERHVRLFLTPRRNLENQKLKRQGQGLPELGLFPTGTVPQPSKAPQHQNQRIPATEPRPSCPNDNMLISSSDMKDQETLQRFQPGLIHFHRTNSTASSSSSLDPPRPGFSRMSSSMSSGSGVSMLSEASFEAVKAEDIVSMYGGFTTSSQKEDPFEYDYQSYPETQQEGEGEEEDIELEAGLGRTSIFSTSSTMTVKPDYIQRQQQYNQPRLSPSIVPQQQQRAPTLSSRPSLFRKRSRVHPYETNAESPSGMEEPPWLANRTISEQMVAQAGLRVQRQRAAVGVRR